MKFIILLILASFANANNDFSEEREKATPLTSSLSMIQGAGGNITASIGEDGVLLVDDDFASMSNKLLEKLKELKGSNPRFIVNTHFHYDHTGGNEFFGTNATIIASTKVLERLMSEQNLWSKQHPAFTAKALPVLTFDQSLTLHLNGEDIKIVHLPHGHTDGDTVVFFQQSNVISTGDLYFSGMYPIFHPEHEGSLDGLVHNLEWVLRHTSASTKIVAGHGPLGTQAELKRYLKMILASINTVNKGIGKGWTLEEIQKDGIAPEWEPYSHGYRNTNQWLQSIFNSLIRKETNNGFVRSNRNRSIIRKSQNISLDHLSILQLSKN